MYIYRYSYTTYRVKFDFTNLREANGAAPCASPEMTKFLPTGVCKAAWEANSLSVSAHGS